MPLDRFLSMNRNQYSQYGNIDGFIELYNWLSDIKQVAAMIEASNRESPAIEGVVEEMNTKFKDSTTLPFEEKGNRQVIGAAIKEILFDFGYLPFKDKVKISKKIPAFPFKSAIQYEYVDAFATKKLEIQTVVKKIKRKPPRSIEKLSREELKQYTSKAYKKRTDCYVRNEQGYIIIQKI